ncbi:hypothetical protein ACN28C_04420 [Plantactinospora sp. WMMC1484]|uniref:hypothetical protein n=1 Tax=Plantactinospora sp. WMMC1484 TaxID=3404122 RepID=UPI003BF5AF77
MHVDPPALLAELRSLRKGRATRHPSFPARLGPQVRDLCGVLDGDSGPAARLKMAETLQALLDSETHDAWVSAAAALALLPEADQRDLAARERWLAGQLHCHERTARRRVDHAFQVLAQKAAVSPPGGPDGQLVERWQVTAIRALLRLDGPTPEITEYRSIVMTGDSVDEIFCRFTLPRGAPGAHDHDLNLELLYGGKVRARSQPHPEHFVYFIQLPRCFEAGATHEYAIRLTLPPGQPMAPHYVMQPLVPIRSFDLNVRFGPSTNPPTVWRVDGVPPRMVDVEPDEANLLQVDRFGELHLRFRNLRQGYAYGLTWSDGQARPGHPTAGQPASEASSATTRATTEP